MIMIKSTQQPMHFIMSQSYLLTYPKHPLMGRLFKCPWGFLFTFDALGPVYMEWGTPVLWGWFLLFSRSGGHKTKETYPTRPGSPTPCKQGLRLGAYWSGYMLLICFCLTLASCFVFWNCSVSLIVFVRSVYWLEPRPFSRLSVEVATSSPGSSSA